jgi:hypothetical protein
MALAGVLGEVAGALGGSDEMVDFLTDLHERRALEPFTTDELIDDIVGAQDEIDRDQLERWFLTRVQVRRAGRSAVSTRVSTWGRVSPRTELRSA